MTEEKRYDIFISYRREDGTQYAHVIQVKLEQSGYRVYFDCAELKDGKSREKIRIAIEGASIFIAILSPTLTLFTASRNLSVYPFCQMPCSINSSSW